MRIELVCLVVALLSIYYVYGAQLKCKDNRKCATWKKQGICEFFDEYTKVSVCPIACGYCKARNKPTGKGKGGKGKGGKGKGGNNSTTDETPYDLFKESIDEKIDPCNDFFAFACGRYAAKFKKTKESMNRLTETGLKLTKLVNEIIYDKKATSTISAIQKMYDYRDACLNVSRIESIDRTSEILADINALGKMPMLEATWTAVPLDTILQGVGAFYTKLDETFITSSVDKFSDGTYRMVFKPASLIMKNLYDYILPESVDKRRALVDFMIEVMTYMSVDVGSTKDLATLKTEITNILALEIQLAQVILAQPDPVNEEDPRSLEQLYDKRTLSELNTIMTTIDIPALILNSDMYPAEVKLLLTPTREVYLYDENTLRQLNAVIQAQTPEVLANYVYLRMIIQNAPYLDARFAAACNQLAQKTDGNPHTSTREQDCYDTTNLNFAMAVDYLFAEKHFDFQTRNKVDQLIENIRQGMREMINADQWLSDVTRKAAINKLEKVRKHLGILPYAANSQALNNYYSKVSFAPTDSYRKMGIRMTKHLRFRNQMNLVIAGYDSLTNKELRATESNAFNLPGENTIVIPVGITYLADFKLAMSTVYGALGFIIGHEFSHSFDSSGAQYDENGNYANWWDATTKNEFNSRTKCIQDQYQAIEISDNKDLYINGTLTLAENVADNAGIKAAYRAFKHHMQANKVPHAPGYSKYTPDQTFFIAAAIGFREYLTPEKAKEMQQTDNHSPAFARINTVFSNYEEFAKAFKCKKGTKMNNPAKRCEVW